MLYVNVIYFLEKEARPVQMNSAQYSSDGEKMEQGLKFILQGLTFILLCINKEALLFLSVQIYFTRELPCG